ncbi:putative hemolysin [Shewanella nanhaiensis]|uniref:putative hemolysin n=1 Tax=Shewanella nanhaiensis TaxID=2864872 RepID=UPI001E52383E|nr:DUF333 domain-containing protein [Shewanella nanhaiensis]
MIKITSLALVITATVALTACNPSEQTSAKADIEQAPSAVSMANPASEYCVSLGGKLEINNEAKGQVGICHLPSGEKIEEWTLYRKANKQEVTTAIDMANPAAKYCESLQGKLALDTGICTLPSGEALDQWELFRRDHKQADPAKELLPITQ